MTDVTNKYPSRVKYEKNNPSVSFRLSREEYRQLDRVRQTTGRSFREMILAGAEMLSKEEMGANNKLKDIEIGVCSECLELLHWDLTDKKELNLLAKMVMDAKICHDKCLDQ